ncbi:caspase-3-like [Phymastichus coffea]|uniref:caspase-3-like n=1 Tax=Phymastichus coffea TaxID=108790 RepID=UPI00273C608F|nr:caspase-3-like [Phymastichus coffea]
MIDYLQQNVNNKIAKNEEKRSEAPSSSENSDCESFDTSDDSSREDNFYTKLYVVKKPLVINVRKATKFGVSHTKLMEIYPMRGNLRGIVLIIANNLYKDKEDQRSGAKYDAENLKQLFKGMGFMVIYHEDLSGKDIDEKVYEFSKMTELRKADSAFIIISSHGNGKIGVQETEILGVDYNSPEYNKVVSTKIINYFTANNCHDLKNKPKVFIFQTCRGENKQVEVSRYRADSAVNSSKPSIDEQHFSNNLRDHQDMLIVYSTLPGFVSFRDHFNGSWFIQVLCEVFMNHAYKYHILDLFSMIDYRLKNMRTSSGDCQTPSITIHGFKNCFLNPGLFPNNQMNGNTKTNPNKRANIMFKCCPDKKANIGVCFQCESIYHYKCAKQLNHVQFIGKVKVNSCCFANSQNSSDKLDNKSLSENVEHKNILFDLKKENNHLEEQIKSLQMQHVPMISNEVELKETKE